MESRACISMRDNGPGSRDVAGSGSVGLVHPHQREGNIMGLGWNLRRRGRRFGQAGGRSLGRAQARPLSTQVEPLEGRCLLAVTSTTPVPISVIEGSPFNGGVMDFTANDAGPFTATVAWGDAT